MIPVPVPAIDNILVGENPAGETRSVPEIPGNSATRLRV